LVIDSSNADVVFEFEAWTKQYNKKYVADADYEHAYSNYLDNAVRVNKLNAESNGKTTYAMTKFADMSPAEFQKMYLNTKPGDIAKQLKEHGVAVAEPKTAPNGLPDTWDWRLKNAVTPVKDQEQCGSCWAFSTTENLESMWFLAGNPIPTLGPQQLVDCDPQSQGCNGGWTYWAFEYLMTVAGQESEASYPYTAQTGTCNYNAALAVATVKNYTFAVPPCESGPCTTQNENLLRSQLANVGPLAICVNAQPWQFYSSGVLSGCAGDAGDLDHCVQLVGYNWPQQYWIVRNSWNTNWGLEGYIYIETGSNQCGIADVVTYASQL
jgi:C1A family cysteine protease